MKYSICHRKPKRYLRAIDVIQNLYDKIQFSQTPEQTGGGLGVLVDSTFNVLALTQSAVATRDMRQTVSHPLPLSQATTKAGICSSTPPRMVTTKTETTTFWYYYGGNIDSDWKINRFEVGNVVNKTSATQSNNPSYSTLEAAWAARETLSYGV